MCWLSPGLEARRKASRQAQLSAAGRTGLQGARHLGSPCCRHVLREAVSRAVGRGEAMVSDAPTPFSITATQLQHRVGRFEPARLRGLVSSSSGHRRSSALCAKWTRSHHAKSSSSPLTGEGVGEETLKFPWGPILLAWLPGLSLRPKEVLPLGGPKSWASRGLREDESGGASPGCGVMRSAPPLAPGPGLQCS